MSDHPRIVEWTDDRYPTDYSLFRLHQLVTDRDTTKAVEAFYAALKENAWPHLYGPEKREVRGEVINVWGYHTGGWSGNEAIIDVLQKSYLYPLLLERYDSGGHYYFKPPEMVKGWLKRKA